MLQFAKEDEAINETGKEAVAPCEATVFYVDIQGNYVEKCSGINTFFALTKGWHISIIIQMVTVCVIVH